MYESDAVNVEFSIDIQQIIDVVRQISIWNRIFENICVIISQNYKALKHLTIF